MIRAYDDAAIAHAAPAAVVWMNSRLETFLLLMVVPLR